MVDGSRVSKRFAKKMRKFSVAFRKLFRVISHSYAKINEAKTKWNFVKIFFAKFENLVNFFCAKCENLNNFFSFTLIIFWWREFDFTSYLLKFLSFRSQYYTQPFSAKFRIILALSLSRNFRTIFLRNFQIFWLFAFFGETDWSEIYEKSVNFRVFSDRTTCENKAKWSRKKKISWKVRNFRETIFPFRWKP